MNWFIVAKLGDQAPFHLLTRFCNCMQKILVDNIEPERCEETELVARNCNTKLN